MKVIKKKVSNFIKMLSIKQLYFTAVLPLSIIGYILIAFSVRNVYFHQIKNTLTSETQNAIMNKTDNFNRYFDSLYYATDSIIYSDATQQFLRKNLVSPSTNDQLQLAEILNNFMNQPSDSYIINSWTTSNPMITISIQNANEDLFSTTAVYETERKHTSALLSLLKNDIISLHGQGDLYWDSQSKSLYFFRAIYNSQISQPNQFLGLFSVRLSKRVFSDAIGYYAPSASTSYCFANLKGEIISNFSLLSDSDCRELLKKNKLTLYHYNYHISSPKLKYGNFILMGIVNDSKLYAGSYRLLRHLLILTTISLLLITGSITLAYGVIANRFNQFIKKLNSTDSFGKASFIHMNVKGEFEELEDVTLLLCEDNWGNMRALPEAFERNHKGGFGMYFHLDYHGDPVSYEWVSSTELSKIWEQMTEAYEYGVRELWIVNVGDVKFQEFPLNYFMDLAYDFEKWGSLAPNSTKEYTRQWIESMFGSYTSKEEREEIQEVLEGYLKINALRKPESLNDTVYHPAHYLECEKLLELCGKLEEKNERLWKTLEERGMGDAYFSMIYFSAEASFNLLKMHLYSGKNHLYASQGKAVANEYDKLVEACIEKDEALKVQMAAFKDGKWAGMELASHIGFTNWNDEDWRYPVRHVIRLPKKPRLVVTRADKTQHYTNQYFPITLVIDDFVVSSSKKAKIQIANGGQGSVKWKIQEGARKVGLDGIAHESQDETSCEWLEFSKTSGETALQDEVVISLKEEKLPLGKAVVCSFEIKTETEFVPVLVKALKKDTSTLPEGAFLAEHGMFVIDAIHYADKNAGTYEEETVEFKELYDFGKYQSGIKAFPVTAAFDSKENAPSVTYELFSEEEKECILKLYTSPANPLIYGGKLSMGVSVNGEVDKLVAFTEDGYKGGEPGCIPWEQAVLNQEHAGSTEIALKKGLNKITVSAREAGLVLERLVVYPKDMERDTSYLGEKECSRVTLSIEK